MASVTSSELQKNFGRWHERAIKEPLQITKHGRETAYLVSAETFNRLWACYRRAIKTSDLSESEMQMILDAEIAPENAYEIEGVADAAEVPKHGGERR
jgi:prevent-host-death family protein